VASSGWQAGSPVVEGKVHGASFVADGARVRAGSTVDDSVIGHNADVGDGAVVRGSVLMGGARVGAGATVVDSIVGPGAVIGARATLEAGSVVGSGDEVAEGDRLPR
jgi:mannose-1-phosphate guanylyltransferase